jgi:hypothetical protein
MSNAPQTTTSTQASNLRELALSVAQHLPGWTISSEETSDYHAALRHESGPELSFGKGRERDRLHVHGSWPRDQRHGSYAPYSNAPAISVSISRDPKAIAREIERRFLPGFLPLWHAAEGRRREAEESNAKAETLAARLRDLFGLPHPEPSRYGNDRDSVHVHAGAARFEVRRYGSVKVEVNTSDHDVVLRLAETVRGLGLDQE